MDYGRPDYGRPGYGPPEYGRRSPDEFRSRSHSRPPEPEPYARPIDKSLRSRSLDYREGLRDDHYRDEGRGITIPIRQEKESRNYDYNREPYPIEIRREDGRRSSRERLPDPRDSRDPRDFRYARDFGAADRMRSARSTEWLDRRPPPFDERRPRTVDKHSPKSVASSRRPNLNLSLEANRPRRIESDFYRPEDYRRDYSRERGGGGDHRGHHHYSYQYESHGGGSSPRRNQPVGPPGPPGPAGRYPGRPVQYRRVKFCCFSFTWPPWSYETTTPPQPIYKNI